jgi:parallel beta-helix repeat protein
MYKRFSSLLAIVLIDGLFLFLLLSLHLLSVESGVAQAAYTIRYVAPDQAQCGINTPCYTQIQAAVDAANAGDEIRVAAGTYAGVSTRGGSTQHVYVDKAVRLRGGYDPVSWAPDPALNASILDAQGLGHVLYVTGNISPAIEGLWLTHGAADRGGGIYIDTAAVTLRDNRIYSNTATYSGGGVYVIDSASTLANNQIYSNTTASSGHGGGITLANSPAQLQDNTITGNRAHVGGGVEIANNVQNSGAFLIGNTIQDNTAFDYEQEGRTFDGAGGGINIGSGYTDTLKRNLIRHNTAKWGGGLHAFGAPAVIAENTFQENYAPTHGGGLYVQGGSPTIQYNEILSNTADNWGGGLWIWVNDARVTHNTLRGNAAGWRGGGMYAQSSAVFDGNIFDSNTAVEQGGGTFSYRDSQARYMNNVWMDNHAAEGAGIYLWGSVSRFTHNTLVNNVAGNGRGVMIDKYPGLVDPAASEHIRANVTLTNTIVASHSVGIFCTQGNTLTVNGVLWNDTITPIQATGVSLTVQNEFTGDPRFQSDGYHLQEQYSAAADRGVAVDLDHDVDGQLRPLYPGYDLGADEIMPGVLINPDIESSITYTDPHDSVAITVTVPPLPITSPFQLQFSPYPPPPPGLADPLLNDWVTFGPPFRLTPLIDGLPVPTLTLSQPLTVTMHYEDQTDNFEQGSLNLFAILQELMGAANDYQSQPAACDPEDQPEHSILKTTVRITGSAQVQICDFGGVPSPVVPEGRTLQYQVYSIGAQEEFVYFMFLAERKEYGLFLPVLLR